MFTYFNDFVRTQTEHPCPKCGCKLSQVQPSNMLVCDNPVCDADPHFLV